jgi:hypothetical protein
VTGSPPFELGADHDTSARRSLAVTVPIVGGPGTDAAPALRRSVALVCMAPELDDREVARLHCDPLRSSALRTRAEGDLATRHLALLGCSRPGVELDSADAEGILYAMSRRTASSASY